MILSPQVTKRSKADAFALCRVIIGWWTAPIVALLSYFSPHLPAPLLLLLLSAELSISSHLIPRNNPGAQTNSVFPPFRSLTLSLPCMLQ